MVHNAQYVVKQGPSNFKNCVNFIFVLLLNRCSASTPPVYEQHLGSNISAQQKVHTAMLQIMMGNDGVLGLYCAHCLG